MLNSVAKYLWGSNSDTEQGPVAADGQDQSEQQQQQHPAAAAEQLATHQDDDDWVVVGLASQDKDNKCDKSLPQGHHHHHHHSSHPNFHHHHGNQPAQAGPELETLDDAASLVHNVGLDGDSNYSSDTESSPESVFSACSGRSHATYQPRGAGSEAWVIAPAPCFTGSQVGTLSPVAASPLENLLIEHPSMSVYLSVAPHLSDPSLPHTHPTHPTGERPSTDPSTAPDSRTQAPVEESSRAAPIPRHRTGGVVPHEPASLQAIARAAQKLELCRAQKLLTAQRCRRHNKVREVKSHPKGKSNNRRGKYEHASGAKCARVSQRM